VKLADLCLESGTTADVTDVVAFWASAAMVLAVF